MRRWLPIALAVVVLLLAAALTNRGRDTGRPLDPASTGPLGTRALVLLLEEFGADVDVVGGEPSDAADVALLLADDLSAERQQRLRAWVEAGGTLVVADPLSVFAPPIARDGGGLFDFGEQETPGAPRCDLPPVQGVRRLAAQGAAPLEAAEPGAVACFPIGGGAYLVATGEGEGTVVALGGAGPFVNAALGEADNAVLAVGLLAPRAGTNVALLAPAGPGGGRRTLTDLIAPGVKAGLAQLAVAFALFALWRARRLGRPILEPMPVAVPGTELTMAVGRLLHRARRRDQAAAMLQGHLRRVLAERLGLPPDVAAGVVAHAAAHRTGRPAEHIEGALSSPSPPSDEELIELAATIESIRTEVLHA